ncbi:Glycerol-3-phosphate cytidylyltransferase [Marinomonas aquimarina]|uniref:Glycerol-3-phosphate cytidylyltransferase n=1 Tax=Marinomonas aquimarina TaxID=295068 RepID=A0A1A8T1E5_9GAMM|nr:glycerol-3-phosphate cytidylyltransferase [Marinomonas aquimarina]SBS25461.1 Glycerol-3-phosphate cytidylyltransferase [Marinomonas aquimarina]
MKIILTYGTFDLFHIGHLNMLKRLRALGDKLIVGVSTDEFNALKGKQSIFSYEERKAIVESNRFVDLVIPERDWQQKEQDIVRYEVDIFAIGEDWQGKFDHLNHLCEVRYLERTENISTTKIKESLKGVDKEKVEEMKAILDDLVLVVKAMS